ncbi:NAD-dependent epimerase/dehydratase family protein [Halorubrum ezzemoulense]|uniref:NAD-dependent epimerase/dehydratase family protein n=1 Tax=Halorubrum ezzemoulense TaxID=337243 RepID=UPI003CCB8056
MYASSAPVYGALESVPIDELNPKQPTSPYGLEKHTTDEYCRLYHEFYGVETIALRKFYVYGSRHRTISNFCVSILSDRKSLSIG